MATLYDVLDRKKVEVILYLINRVVDPTYMSVAKLLYFVDKTSLEEFGTFVTDDSYVAMKNGPVPSRCYDLMKASDDTDRYGFVTEYVYHLRPLRDADMEELSEADIQCLDRVINAYGKFPTWHLRDISHDRAWELTWAEAAGRGSVPMPIERIADCIDTGDEIIEYLNDADDE